MNSIQKKAWQAILEAISRRIAENPRGELSAVASEIGVARATVSRWLSGKLKGIRVPYDKMVHIMLILGIDPELYYGRAARVNRQGGHVYGAFTHASPRENQPGDAYAPEEHAYYRVPWLEARASMGGGSFEASKEVKSYLSFRRDWLLSKGNARNMVVISVEGESMSPTIPDGSVVLVNETGVVPPVNNRIYLVCYKDELFLKRLRVKEGRVTALVSDQDGSEISVREGEYFNILGRAIWYGKDL